MRRSGRRAIFYFLIAVFIVVTPAVVLYAIGYGIDLTERSLTRTGGFFVKTNAAGIKVLIDGIPRVETNFISRGALITGLLPGLYAVQIEKDGVSPWRKSVEIQKQLIQEFRSVILVPEELPEKIIFQTPTTTGSSLIPRAIIPNRENSRLLWASERNGESIVYLIRQNGGTHSPVALRPGNKFEDAAWNKPGNRAIVRQRARTETVWSLVSAEDARPEALFPRSAIVVNPKSATTSPETLPASGITRVTWQDDAGRFYILSKRILYSWDRASNRADKILENVHSFEALDDRILFVTMSGFLAEARAAGSEIAILDRPGFFMNETPFAFFRSENGIRGVVDSAGGLYLEHTGLKRFIPIQGNAIKARVAPERQILAFARGAVLETISLADETRQPFRKLYDKKRVLDAVVPIKDFIWFGKESTHFIFTTADGVFLTEEDARFGVNTTTLKTGSYVIAAAPDSANRFYLTDGKTLEEITIEQ